MSRLHFVRTFALATLLPSLALATDVAGPVSVNTLWSAAGSPWVIKGDVTVGAGVTLTLEAGAQVTFASGDTMAAGSDTSRTELIVNGTLAAPGTSSSGVTITATSGYGLRVNGTATLSYVTLTGGNYGLWNTGTSTFDHVTIQDPTQCLRNDAGTVTFSSGTFSGCPAGVQAGGGTTNVSYTVIKGCGSAGNGAPAVYLAADASLTHDTIADNFFVGVRIEAVAGNVSLVDNIVASNGVYGILFNSSTPTQPTRTVHHNDVWGHTSQNHFNVSAGAGSFTANPLLAPVTEKLTANSPARFVASDGSDLGALTWSGDVTTGLIGTLYTSRTLTGANTLAGDLTVAAGATLTIAAGATITVAAGDTMGAGNDASRTELVIHGTLDMQGTSASPVTVNATDGYGIRVTGTSTLGYVTITGGNYALWNTGTSTLDHVTIQNATQCLRNDAGTVTFANGTFSGCPGGVRADGGATNVSYTVVKGCGHAGNGAPAVYLAGNGSFTHNTIAESFNVGLRIESFAGTMSIVDNIIASSGSYGLLFNSGSPTSPTRTVHHNDIWGHTSQDLFNVSAGTGGFASNPLLTSGTVKLTANSPARFMASDGTDLGAQPWSGDVTTGLIGTLYTSRTLTGANTLTGDLTVASGATLTIAAGATITFAAGDTMGAGNDPSRTELVIHGTLDMQGTSASPVTVNATNGYGLRVTGSSTLGYVTITGGNYALWNTGTSTLDHVTIQNPTQCLRNDAGTVTFANGTFSGCTGGVRADGGTTNMSYSVIKGCGSAGNAAPAVYLAGPASFAHNTIAESFYVGLRIESFAGSVSIFDNVIASSGSYGLLFNSSTPTSPTRIVHHNDIWGHTSENLFNVSAGTGGFASNPLLTAGTVKLTSNSPARLAASDGTDLGAQPWSGDTTPGLIGTLYASRTLTGANTLAGDLTVAPGATLTIAAGATITFATGDTMAAGNDTARVELVVNGTLAVQGTSASPVTVNATNGHGLRVTGTATLDYVAVTGGKFGLWNTGTSTLDHVTIQSPTQCLRNDAGTVTFTNGTFSGCADGLRADGGTTNMSYTVITSCGHAGNAAPAVYFAGPASFTHNTIAESFYVGLRIESFAGSVSIFDNIIASSGSYGLLFNSPTPTSPTRIVHHNDIWGHTQQDLYNVAAGTGGFASNPLLTAGTVKLTSNSPARQAASDGTDLGAQPWSGDATPALIGTLYTSRTLTGANTLAGDLTVAPGATLTIAAGATLTFATGDTMAAGIDTTRTELVVKGTLSVLGTSASPVTVNATNGYGLRVTGTSTLGYVAITGGNFGLWNTGTSTLDHVTIQNPTQCLRNDAGTVTFTNGTFSGCPDGLRADGGTTNMSYTVIKGSGHAGNNAPALFLAGPATLTHNTIADNFYMGVRVENFAGSVTFIDNVIASNGYYGVYFNAGAPSPARTLHHNDVWGHPLGDLTNATAGTGGFASNPLLTPGTLKLTSNSPARFAASDATDLGALAWSGDTTAGLLGTLYTSRTLTGANTLAGDLTVAAGATLTIAAGATIAFASGDSMAAGNDTTRTELVVKGTLSVPGTSASPVTVNATNGYGLRVTGTSTLGYVAITGGNYGLWNTGTSTFDHVTIQNPTQCLRNDAGTVTFTNGTFSGCADGLRADGGTTNLSYTVIKGSGHAGNNAPGLFLGGPGTLTHNTIADNFYMGVRVENFAGSVSLVDNVIANNGFYGVYFNAGAPSPARTAHHNDVFGHTLQELTNVTAGSGGLSVNPLFVSAPADHRLQGASPVRNAASDGTDMGAFSNEPPPVATIVVAPSAPSVGAGATRQFSATAFDAFGSPIPTVAFTWSATAAAGRISAGGLFAADCTPGTYTNAVSAVAEGKTGSTNVTVTFVAAPALCDDGNACTADSCTTGTGCVHASLATTISCDDGNACTQTDKCDGYGSCAGSNPVVCTAANDCQLEGTCSPASGLCSSTPKTDGTPCSDGSACSAGDACAGGTCSSGTPVGCSDGNICTTDTCAPATGCAHAPIAACDPNQCATLNCDDSNPCTADSCSAASGCAHAPVANGTSCSDANACNGGETCQVGVCAAGTPPSCEDNNACTDDTCDAGTGCAHTNNTASCSDGDACTQTDQCAAGSCVGGNAVVCLAASQCQVAGTCDPLVGLCDSPPAANGTTCNDANACTTGDHCTAGACVAGAATSCDDHNACTNDSCVPASGCAHANNAASCNDNNVCTSSDHCAGGSCVGGSTLTCNDSDSCTTDTCRPVNGCTYTSTSSSCPPSCADSPPGSVPPGSICSSATGNPAVRSACFVAFGGDTFRKEIVQTFTVNDSDYAGRLRLVVRRLDVAQGATSLNLEVRKLDEHGRIPTDSVTGSFALGVLTSAALNDLELGVDTVVEIPFDSGAPEPPGTAPELSRKLYPQFQYAIVVRVPVPGVLALGVACHTAQPFADGQAWTRQLRKTGGSGGISTYSTPAFTKDLRDLAFVFTLGNGLTTD